MTRLGIGIKFPSWMSLERRLGGVKQRAKEERMRAKNGKLGQPSSRSWLPAAAIGAGAGAIAGLQILLGNFNSCSPRAAPGSCLLVGLAFGAAGFVFGAAFGGWGERLFDALRADARCGRMIFGFLAPALAFLPGLAAFAVLPYLAFKVGRRRFLPRRSRLDSLLALFLLWASVASIPTHELAPVFRSRTHRGVPVPGSIPVLITVHPEGGFPETTAVHPPIEPLAASIEEKRDALWSGQAPRHSGSSGRLLLPGGGILEWVPPKPWSRRLLSLLARPAPATPTLHAGLAELARTAGIPVLDSAPDPHDPPLALRILETNSPVAPQDAERFRAAGAWIDVTLAEQEKLAFSGQGIRVLPDSMSASLLDVLPTALHLLGLAVPRDAGGRVLAEILDPASPGARVPRYRSGSSSASTTAK